MIGLRSIHHVFPRSSSAVASAVAPSVMKFSPTYIRSFSTTISTRAKQEMNMADIPITNIGVMADYYVPPSILKQPMKFWPVLLGRRFLLFAGNTYNIVKYKQETGSKLNFNRWKDDAIEKYVKMNKAFASACNQPILLNGARERYIIKNLTDDCGRYTILNLIDRVQTFPLHSTVTWELVNILKNPKIVSFNCIPDQNNVLVFVQFVMKLETTQKMTITTNGKDEVSNVNNTDYLVYTLNPHTNESALVGKVFESNNIRKVAPDYTNQSNPAWVKRFLSESADIYRANPNLESKDKV
ncbi:Inner membrane mitoribosome receptor MBA1 mitochondrial [Spathaspora sp. JA1]|nr:Inner membrane mitoribosome receptor MBA1 mitochondrial [Spathaspora sp. JA1]